MRSERPYCVVDAFTNRRYAGNPAAIVFDADGLDDGQMQRIAAEFNLSETTFILPPRTDEASMRFRWFTPAVEVAMCGHATIAAVHALVESGRLEHDHDDVTRSTGIGIDTLSGTLTAFVENLPATESSLMIWLDMPDPSFQDRPYPPEVLSEALNVPPEVFHTTWPVVETRDHDLLVFVDGFAALNDARPDFGKMLEWHRRDRLRGLCLSTVGTVTPSVHVQSRFFAPACGVDEDPVTGSVHGPLAAYLAARGVGASDADITVLTCVQGKPAGRTGLLHALVRQQPDGRCSVRIGGQAVTTMRGTLAE